MGSLCIVGALFHQKRIIPSRKLTSLPAEPPWYAIRMPGGVGGLLSDGESYPDYVLLSTSSLERIIYSSNVPNVSCIWATLYSII